MPWRTLGAVALIVVGVGAVIFALFGPALGKSNTTQYITSQAATTNVLNQAVADGTVSAAQDVRPFVCRRSADRRRSSSSQRPAAAARGWSRTSTRRSASRSTRATCWPQPTRPISRTRSTLAQANLAAAQAKSDADTGGPTSTDQQSAQISIDQAQQQLDAANKSRDDTKNQNDIKLTQSQDAVTQAQQQLSTRSRETTRPARSSPPTSRA